MKVFVLVLALAVARGAIVPQESGLRLRFPVVGGTADNPIITWPDIPVTPDGKIVGGSEAIPHEFPWQVNIIMDGAYLCGGSIVAANKVLTAAHCCDGYRSFRITAGDHSRSQSDGTEQVVTASVKSVHPNWNANTLANDVCVITLPSNLNLNDNVNVAPPPDPANANDHAGDTVTVTGWGRTQNTGGTTSDVLKKVDVQVITNAECSAVYGTATVNAGTICISTDGGEGSCNGDSGGPMIDNARTTLIGVVSFGSSAGCAIGYPSGFSRVSYFHDWIMGQIAA